MSDVRAESNTEAVEQMETQNVEVRACGMQVVDLIELGVLACNPTLATPLE